MAPPPPPLPELVDDVTAEILRRLPPDEPEHLFRSALVFKPWLRILCDRSFLRRYRAFHGAPPLLGLLHRIHILQGDPADRFASTTSMPDFPRPSSFGRHPTPLDCRHGLVLIQMLRGAGGSLVYLVWDPVTGERHLVPSPEINWLIHTAAVFCSAPPTAATIWTATAGPSAWSFWPPTTTTANKLGRACTPLKLVCGACRYLLAMTECYVQHVEDAIREDLYHVPYVLPKRGAVIGDEVYFTLRRGNAIVKYDGGNNCLSMINPPSRIVVGTALMVNDDGSLGFACIEGFSLYFWSRKVNSQGDGEWVQCRVIELQKIVPVANPGHTPFVVGCAEGVGVIFMSSDAGLFTIDLKSGRVKKVDEMTSLECTLVSYPT